MTATTSGDLSTAMSAGRRVQLRILVLVAAAVCFEVVAVAMEIAGVGGELTPRVISLVAIGMLVLIVTTFINYTRPAKGTRVVLISAAALILFHQILRVTDKIQALDTWFLLGESSAAHQYALQIAEPVGLALLLGGLFLIGAGIFRVRKAIEAEKRELEQQLKEKQSLDDLEAKVHCLFDAVHDIVTTMKPDGTITDINHTARGYTREKTIGTSSYEYMPPDEAARVRKIAAEVCADKGIRAYELRAQGDDGAIAYYDCRMGPILKDGEVVELITMGRDITIQRRSREALAQIVQGTASAVGEEFFHSLVKHLSLALECRYAFVGQLTGPQHDRVQTLAVWNGDAHAENFEYSLQHSPCADVVSGNACAFARDVRQRFPKDELLARMNVEGYLGTPLHDRKGNTVGLLVVMDDKSMMNPSLGLSILSVFASRAEAELERQRADEERHYLEAQVQHAQKLESLGVLAGGIAHDFNNLLVGILGYIGLTRDALPPNSAAHEHLNEIELGAKRAAELTHQMLAYSGRGRLSVEHMDAAELIDEIVHLVHASISKKASLDFNFQPDLGPIQGDPTQIRQVFMNLITNASDALGEKPGRISVSARSVELVEGIETIAAVDPLPPGQYVCVSVSDTGAGMDEETRNKMFDPFFTTKFSGRGLGLAAVLGIVRGHGGGIVVDSAPGNGTTVDVYLPAASEKPPIRSNILTPLDEPAEALPANGNGHGTILFADDEAYIRTLARRVLENVGYSVIDAANGEEAVQKFRAHADEIKAVVLDLTMPVLSGDEAYEQIRMIRPDVRVLLSSGYAQQDAAARLAQNGIAGFLQKPYPADVLVNKVRRLLSRQPPIAGD